MTFPSTAGAVACVRCRRRRIGTIVTEAMGGRGGGGGENPASQVVSREQLEGNVLLEPAAPMFHQLIFGNFSLKNVVWLIGETCCP